MEIQLIDSIHRIHANEWNSLCKNDYPFIRHAFLAALENSQSVGGNTGWQIAHLVVRDQQQLIAAMPGYIKTHSYGEYVFDWSWADAYRRYGQDYYPKWINAIPFTPCAGQRLLCNNQNLSFLIKTISEFLQKTCDEKFLSSWHCLFVDEELHQYFEQENINTRLGCQFHWFNRNYQCFDDFLSQLNSRKRKNIRKERQDVVAQGFIFTTKSGRQLTTKDAELFYELYRNTYLKRSGHTGYLSCGFFTELIEKMPEQLLLIEAIKQDSQQTIAAAFFLKDSQTLYGRYWGCFEEYQFLHFETCYYQAIDYAIQHQLRRVDGGAQGEHKIARGFEPCITWSHHWIKDTRFQPAIAHFLKEEAESIKRYATEAASLLPFKQKQA